MRDISIRDVVIACTAAVVVIAVTAHRAKAHQATPENPDDALRVWPPNADERVSYRKKHRA